MKCNTISGTSMWTIICKNFSTKYNKYFSTHSKIIIIIYNSNKHIFKCSVNISGEKIKITLLITHVLQTGTKINIPEHTMDLYTHNIQGYSFHFVRIAQSVQRLATGWTVRGLNSGVGEILYTCPDRPWGPPSFLYNGYRVFPGGKEWSGRDADP